MNTLDRWFEDYRSARSGTAPVAPSPRPTSCFTPGQTGDFFPHHMDAEWAATQPIGQRIAHGTLILSIAVGMTAGDINPQSMSYGYDRIRFIKPVVIGDTITVAAEIAEKTDHPRQPERFGFLHEAVTATNQRDETVLVLTHVYLVNKRSAPNGSA